MVTYEALVAECLAHGVMPAVVPQLKTITLGGAVAGVGIESSSHRHGLVHDSMLEIEVLLGDGRIVTCTPDNEHADLFFGFPNSYGTLGYALRVKVKTVPVKPFVRLQHTEFKNPPQFFEELGGRLKAGEADFIDGTVFNPGQFFITLGSFIDSAPYTSDYTYENIYYQSIRGKREDYLTVRDFLWRWDTDWFWCSKNVFAQQPLVRRLFGRKHLNSITYQRIMRWNARWGLTRALHRLQGVHPESVIQDVDIPLDRAAEFLAFMHKEVGILPIWICPIKASQARARFALYPLRPATVYINFGFWDVVTDRVSRPSGYYNRKVEHKVADLGGLKSLYSDSYYSEEEFWATYNRPAYEALKQRYD